MDYDTFKWSLLEEVKGKTGDGVQVRLHRTHIHTIDRPVQLTHFFNSSISHNHLRNTLHIHYIAKMKGNREEPGSCTVKNRIHGNLRMIEIA